MKHADEIQERHFHVHLAEPTGVDTFRKVSMTIRAFP